MLDRRNAKNWFGCVAGFAMLLMFPESVLSQEEIFSGPQVGESLVSFEVQQLYAESDTKLTLGPLEGDACQMLIFVHEVTRPSVGLTRQLAEVIAKLEEPRPAVSVVFLTEDPTATQQWANNARRALPADIPLAISLDGKEGPGALGLNRSVAMTILIAKGAEIKANFALVQPSQQADAPRILEALCTAAGLDFTSVRETLRASAGPAPGGNAMRMDDDTFRMHVRPLLNTEATAEQIAEIAKGFDQLAEQNPAFRNRLIEAAKRIVDSGNLANYGNEHAQEVLRTWAAKTIEPMPGR